MARSFRSPFHRLPPLPKKELQYNIDTLLYAYLYRIITYHFASPTILLGPDLATQVFKQASKENVSNLTFVEYEVLLPGKYVIFFLPVMLHRMPVITHDLLYDLWKYLGWQLLDKVKVTVSK